MGGRKQSFKPWQLKFELLQQRCLSSSSWVARCSPASYEFARVSRGDRSVQSAWRTLYIGRASRRSANVYAAQVRRNAKNATCIQATGTQKVSRPCGASNAPASESSSSKHGHIRRRDTEKSCLRQTRHDVHRRDAV